MIKTDHGTDNVNQNHVNKIFDLLGDLYGTKFTGQYKNLDRAKKSWLTMLEMQELQSLRKAMQFLRSGSDLHFSRYPPTAIELKKLCEQYSSKKYQTINEQLNHDDDVDGEHHKKAMAFLEEMKNKIQNRGPRA